MSNVYIVKKDKLEKMPTYVTNPIADHSHQIQELADRVDKIEKQLKRQKRLRREGFRI